MRTTPIIALGSAVAATVLLAGCTPKAPTADSAEALTVSSTAEGCEVSAAEAPSGPVTFQIANDGDQVTEFYVLAEDQLRIVGEKENILAGTTSDFTVVLKPGTYYTSCKPGMIGDGVGTAEFTVTDSGTEIQAGSDSEEAQLAVDNYVAYVKDQVAQLQTATEEFAELYTSGDDDAARALYPQARAHYERIEPTAESFGDLDPKIDFREPMASEDGIPWTGWHAIEKDLWAPEGFEAYDDAKRTELADQLVADTGDLYDAVYAEEFAQQMDIATIANGAIGLLDEVATSKISGEEEEFSHTDLWDFAANVDGASVAYGNVRDIAESKGADGEALVADIDDQFAAMEDLLAQHGSQEDGFTAYDELSDEQIKALSDQVNALSEPLSQLTSTVLQIPAED